MVLYRMCRGRRFTIFCLILNTLLLPSLSYKILNVDTVCYYNLGYDREKEKPGNYNASQVRASLDEGDEPRRFFGDILSNPAYQKGVKLERKKTPYRHKNKNVLKNLGKAHYEGILKRITSIIESRVRSDKGEKGTEGRKKGPKPTIEPYREESLNINDLKRSMVYNQLKKIREKNNLQSERILRTEDFIDGMNYRRMGESDFLVSQLCIGTSMYDNPELIDAEHSVEIMETALKRYGINYFDTCEYDPYPYEPRSYTEGHHKTLKEFIKRAGRQNIVLSGRISSSNLGKYKTSGRFLSWVRDDINSPPNMKTVEGAVDKLLESLGTDYLDILSFVYPYRYVPLAHLGEDTYCWSRESEGGMKCEDKVEDDYLDRQVEIFNKLVSKGKIRSVGLSNETVWGMYQMKYHSKRKFNLVCSQHLYNLLHRNEVESSGLVEASLREHFNCPIVAYGCLAGGILTGKYIDPERFNPMGADKIREVSSILESTLPKDLETAEDYGHLSYGPANSRCNIFPETYHTHRTVWSQHATAEYLKLARTFGLTLSQMALSWCFSRPFIASTIIAPRSIGQLHESISALNYPFPKELEEDIHEIFLRYRAPTMGGPQLLSKIEDEFQIPMSQNDLVRQGPVPIWSGGSHWDMDHIPSLQKVAFIRAKREDFLEIRRIFGLMDKPNDYRWPNYRCWVERINEGLPGEYFAVKESKLFSWDTMKLDELTLVNKTPEEIARDDTSDFHFYWKGGKVYVGPTSPAIYQFYEDMEAVNHVKNLREESFKGDPTRARSDEEVDVWPKVDADLVYKRLMEEHGINPVDQQDLEETLYKYSIRDLNLTEEERKCEKFAYLDNKIEKSD